MLKVSFIYNNKLMKVVARLKYIKTDVMSFKVVINGPEATAGSIFNLFIKSGISAPDKVATIKVTKIDVPTSRDRKSTRLNSSHVSISYAVFCLKKKK